MSEFGVDAVNLLTFAFLILVLHILTAICIAYTYTRNHCLHTTVAFRYIGMTQYLVDGKTGKCVQSCPLDPQDVQAPDYWDINDGANVTYVSDSESKFVFFLLFCFCVFAFVCLLVCVCVCMCACVCARIYVRVLVCWCFFSHSIHFALLHALCILNAWRLFVVVQLQWPIALSRLDV